MTKRPALRVVRERHTFYAEPEDLHTVLEPIASREITFGSEKAMASYRKMLYTINKQGTYRYRTLRSEASMYAIIIWRMA